MGSTQLDLFWTPLIETDCAGMIADRFWDSLGSMARDVDVVLLGRPVAVKERRASTYLRSDTTVMEIAIDEVIRGTPVTRDDGLIELEMYYGPPPEPSLGLPANRHLFFLRSVARQNAEYGQLVTEVDRYSYNLPSLYQNVFVEVGGDVFVPAVNRIRQGEGEGAFPARLHGRSFEDVLANLRNATGDVARDQSRVIGSMLVAC